MDNKDKKLLYYLDKDARTSYSQLAKLTRISQETARYRVNHLLTEGIIKKFVTIINTTKLGAIPYQIFLKLQNIDETTKEKMINYLKNDKGVAWIANIEGNYDLAIIITAKNPFDLQEIIEKVYKLFKKHIIKKTLSIHISGQFFPRDYLIEKKRESRDYPKYSSEGEIIKLDKIDSQICAHLAKNGRISFVEIASKIGTSADIVAKRIKKLQKEKIIVGSIIILDQEKTGRLYYKILFYLNNLSPEITKLLISKIQSDNRVLAIVKTLAEWDYEVDLEVEHPNQLREFIMKISKEFSNMIKDYETIRIIDMPKYNFIP